MPEPEGPSSRRLIIPGSESEPEPTSTPRIVLPGGEDAASEPAEGEAEPEVPRGKSRIILPPGVAPAVEDVPEFPKLRPLILMPFVDGQRELLLVQDPLGVIQGQPVLGMESVALLELFDGNTSINDITAALMRESKDLRVANMVKDFVAKLDELLMLDSPRFQTAYQTMRDAYHPLEIRQSVFDGRSYPADRTELVAFLDEHFKVAEQWRASGDVQVADATSTPGAEAISTPGAEAASTPVAEATSTPGAEAASTPVAEATSTPAAEVATASAAPAPAAESAPARAAAPRTPRALMAPHLDPRRAGPAMARAFLEIDAQKGGEPLRVVVFGTGHSLMGDLFALTRKHFDTTLGRVECDIAFVDAVAAPLGDAAYRSELAHRDEHSIEFAAVYLKHHMGERAFTIVPILCGGFHTLLEDGTMPREHAEFEALIQAVRSAASARGGTTLYLAAVDFSHVGPRFNDPRLNDAMRTEIEAIDRDAIESARQGDADAWFRSIAAHGDSTRICGFAPTYAMLRCAEPGAGRLLRYERSEEKDSSLVTVASMAW